MKKLVAASILSLTLSIFNLEACSNLDLLKKIVQVNSRHNIVEFIESFSKEKLSIQEKQYYYFLSVQMAQKGIEFLELAKLQSESIYTETFKKYAIDTIQECSIAIASGGNCKQALLVATTNLAQIAPYVIDQYALIINYTNQAEYYFSMAEFYMNCCVNG